MQASSSFFCGLILNVMVGATQAVEQNELAILTVAKNEADVLREWFEFHLAEGVSSFYIIDHGSTDSTNDIISEYAANGVAKVVDTSSLNKSMDHFQEAALNFARVRLQGLVVWLALIDVDEYLWAPSHARVLDVLRQMKSVCGQIYMPWMNFGSNGRVEQPRSVVHGFTKSSDAFAPIGKSIVRLRALTKIVVHMHEIDPSYRTASVENHAEISMCWGSEAPSTSLLRINHYPIMSENRFRKIKMTRGDVQNFKVRRDMGYFRSFDAAGSKIDNYGLVRKAIRRQFMNQTCLKEGYKYEPINMAGQGRTENDVCGCQTRCFNTRGCAHFSFWYNGGCHLQDHFASLVEDSAALSGTPLCQATATVSSGNTISTSTEGTSSTMPVSPGKSISTSSEATSISVQVPKAFSFSPTLPFDYEFRGMTLLLPGLILVVCCCCAHRRFRWH